MREGGLSKARRPVKEHVVKGFAPHLGSLHIDVQIGHYLLLSGEIFQPLRADNSVQILIFAGVCAVRIKFCHQKVFLISTKIVKTAGRKQHLAATWRKTKSQ